MSGQERQYFARARNERTEHVVYGALARRDGKPLGVGLSPTQPFQNRPAIQISRRTIHPDARFETAARKLVRVLHWLATRP